MDLIDLYEDYRLCPDFAHLQREGIVLVPGRGAHKPTVMILGEAPGAQENLNKKPFVGQSGRLLMQLMDLAGLYAEDIVLTPADVESGEPEVIKKANTFITNTIKFRPPGNRTPTPKEINASLPWIRKEWNSLGRPPVIVTTGSIPTACIAGKNLLPISEHAGSPVPLAAGGPTIWPMYHPAYPLRYKKIRPEVEDHWEKLGEWLSKEGLL